jgi:hypothetical protein
VGGLHLDVDPWEFVSEDNGQKVAAELAALRYGVNKLNNFIFENNQVPIAFCYSLITCSRSPHSLNYQCSHPPLPHAHPHTIPLMTLHSHSHLNLLQIHQSMHNGLHVQGVLNFLDNLEEDGGFYCVPGFKHHFKEW